MQGDEAIAGGEVDADLRFRSGGGVDGGVHGRSPGDLSDSLR